MREDVERICGDLGILALDLNIPWRKGSQRIRTEPYQAYYFRFLKEEVARHRANDLVNFGYSWFESSDSK
jgi:hypothetical protein